MHQFCLTAIIALAASVSLCASDWPRFHGPNGTGVVEGTLPAIQPKTPLWKVAIPGKGVSSPIVVDGKVLLQSASDDGAKRSLICLDAATGRMLWTKEVPGKTGKKHNKNSLASGTPASDGSLVYCLWWDGDAMTLAAYDLSGNEKWSYPLGSYRSDHGAGHSPAVYDGVVYVNLDGSADMGGSASLLAFDAKTGAKKWAVERKAHRASYSTPFLHEIKGKPREIIVGTTTEVTGYDALTGEVNWAFPMIWGQGKMPLRVVGSPVVAAGLVICYCGDGGGARFTVGIDASKKQATKVWELNKGTPYVPCMLVKDDLLFWIADNGVACCAQAGTGKILWEERLSSKDVTSSPILVGNEILIITELGSYYVLKASREFEILRKGELGESVSASPALADGKLYVRGTSHLFCFGNR